MLETRKIEITLTDEVWKTRQLPTAYALRALRRGLAVRSCRGDNES